MPEDVPDAEETQADQAASTALGSGCLLIFGLPFLLVGLGILAWGTLMWLTYLRSASWVPTEVTITGVELVRGGPVRFGTTHGQWTT